MKKVIGIVGEGPLDQIVLRTAIDRITGERNMYRYIQPEQDVRGEYGNGWKGVYRWCETHARLIPSLFTDISPGFDLLIIQMDGDVARKEREVHCICNHTACDKKGSLSPLKCIGPRENTCPVIVPCTDHNSGPEGYRQHLTDLLRGLLEVDSSEKRVVFVIPCDSTDAWIVAAYDDIDNIENVEDPWMNIIAHKKEYHGIRVHGHKKSAAVFRNFMPKLSSEWDCVTKKCASAKLLDEAVRNS